MPKQPCQHCGLPTWVPEPKASVESDVRPAPRRPVFCCTGCAFAHRLTQAPETKGSLTPLQIAAWLSGFAVFNQGVFWALRVLLRDEGRAGLSEATGYVSIGLGAVVWIALVAVCAAGRRWSKADLLVWALTLANLFIGFYLRSPACALESSLGLALWTARGFFRRRAS